MKLTYPGIFLELLETGNKTLKRSLELKEAYSTVDGVYALYFDHENKQEYEITIRPIHKQGEIK